jgi:hypothetical protein
VKIAKEKFKPVLPVWGGCLIGILTLLAGWWLLALLPRDRYSAISVISGFSQALRANNSELAKSLVVSEQYIRVDDWIAKHKAFTCPPVWPWDIDSLEGEGTGGGVFQSVGENTASAYWGYGCRRGQAYYGLSLKGIELQETNGQWLIQNWEEICETRVGEETCR